MKTAPPACPYPETGARYWRGPEELSDSPEFRAWVEQEFPAGAEEMKDGATRRDFVKLMSASFLLAGLGIFGVGCRRPEEEILPFAKHPEGYIHGVPQQFATAMPTRTGAIPLVARSDDGRPTKVEGNAHIPGGNGGTDVFAQASVLSLYDPDRARRFARRGTDAALAKAGRNEALDALAAVGQKFSGNGGEGLSFLTQRTHSPTELRVRAELQTKFPRAKWFAHEPVDFDLRRRSASTAFGRPVQALYHLDKAAVILSLDCDFLSTEAGMETFSRDFARTRKASKARPEMSRLFVVEALMTLTGGAADHRLRVPASQVLRVAAQIADLVLADSGIPGSQTGDLRNALTNLGRGLSSELANADWIRGCANDLLAHKGKAVVLAGYQQPLEVQLIAHALNFALGGQGTTYELVPAPDLGEGSLGELAAGLNAGSVDTLVIIGANPAYDAPVDVNWSAAQAKAGNVVRIGYFEDETAATCHWHFPLAHYLESWGDAHTAEGVLVPVQPLIQPLFGGITVIEFLARIGGLASVNPYELVRETFARATGGSLVENAWKKFLHDGFLAGTGHKAVEASVNWRNTATAVATAQAAAAPSADTLEVVFARDARVDDGRYANNGWLQELPDPVTKVAWENVIAMSKETAKALGVFPSYWNDAGWLMEYENLSAKGLTYASLIKLTLAGREVIGPLWIQPGLAENTVVLQLGYGRTKAGRIGDLAGYNAYALRSAAAPWITSGGSVSVERDRYEIACTQTHWKMEGRPIVREANLEQFKQYPEFATAMNGHEMPGGNRTLYPNPLDELRKNPNVLHQWGMAIDLGACTGCSACVIACQSENNIPIVGKRQMSRSREMHWLRIDRYFAGPFTEPQMTNQPMMCQHCEAAPCESVCPVNATVHDEEGLNVMAYNRCVGTRYCSNNCPYKVRRYNFFDYHKRSMKQIAGTETKLLGTVYSSPLTSRTDGEWDLLRWWKDPDNNTGRPTDEWELLKLVKNPDVSVRMRGVMEKCTFCTQRIEQAKISRKVKARASGDVAVPDGELKTACQQACPAEAIAFGNLNDDQSTVSRWKADTRNYSVLDYLLTKPRLTYLARVRNPNPAMPDHTEHPISTTDFAKTNHVHGNPNKAHHGGHHGDHGHAADHGANGDH